MVLVSESENPNTRSQRTKDWVLMTSWLMPFVRISVVYNNQLSLSLAFSFVRPVFDWENTSRMLRNIAPGETWNTKLDIRQATCLQIITPPEEFPSRVDLLQYVDWNRDQECHHLCLRCSANKIVVCALQNASGCRTGELKNEFFESRAWGFDGIIK